MITHVPMRLRTFEVCPITVGSLVGCHVTIRYFTAVLETDSIVCQRSCDRSGHATGLHSRIQKKTHDRDYDKFTSALLWSSQDRRPKSTNTKSVARWYSRSHLSPKQNPHARIFLLNIGTVSAAEAE
jgi:hypothetical protein